MNERTPFVLFAAMKKTPKVAKARITAALGSVSTPTALAFAIIYKRAKAKNERLSRDAAKKKAGAMIRARRASVRYVSLGWLKALSKWKQVQKPLKETSIAAKEGWGKRATRFAHRTKFRNAAPGVKHGVDALKQAMAYPNLIFPACQFDGDYSHASIASRMRSAVSAWGPLLVSTWIGASA